MKLGSQKNTEEIKQAIRQFLVSCQIYSPFAYGFTSGGPETLYASAFAAMLLHYLGDLDRLSDQNRKDWIEYLNSWQDSASGLFVGPEVNPENLENSKHDWEHVTMHLTAHILPALSVLGAVPAHSLSFMEPFLDKEYLLVWLRQRDWTDAWLEGNNLLFIGQFLIHMRDVESRPEAQGALNFYFDWLGEQVDSATGLWGTNGHCSNATAMYGGYHQLLTYYYENRPILHHRELVDTVLALQHPDGGFAQKGGGGACEDVDAVDILVNLYKLFHYKRKEIRKALRRALREVLNNFVDDGGFVYRRDTPFIYMELPDLCARPNQSTMFSTWFRVHTLALIAEILTDEPRISHDWRFNTICSMGWHRQWDKSQRGLTMLDRTYEHLAYGKSDLRSLIWTMKHSARIVNRKCPIVGKMVKWLR